MWLSVSLLLHFHLRINKEVFDWILLHHVITTVTNFNCLLFFGVLMTVNPHIMLHKKKITNFPKIVISTTVFHIDNNQKSL